MLNLINGGGVGISKYPLISVMDEKRKQINLEVSKLIRSEASKNKVSSTVY